MAVRPDPLDHSSALHTALKVRHRLLGLILVLLVVAPTKDLQSLSLFLKPLPSQCS